VTGPQSPIDDERLKAALAWHVRIEGDVPEDVWLGFVQWLEADPLNRLAFDKVAAMSDAVTAQLSATSETPAVASISRRAWNSVAFLKQAWVPMTAAAVILAALFFQVAELPRMQNFSTAVGQRQDITLDDGSVIHLNTDTALLVSMSRDVRNVRLDKGEVEFEVTADPARPFRIEMGARRIEVVGTEFNILRHNGRQTIAVEQGVVQVRHDGGEAVRLLAGEQYLGREDSPEYQIVKISPAAIAPWRAGQLVFEDVPLAQVAAELNRYFPRAIVIDDVAVRGLRFSGILKIDNELAVARRLEAFLPIAVQLRGDELVLTRGPSK